MRTYVLDTCILIHYLKSSELYMKIDEELGLSNADVIPVISSVTKGELFSFAQQRKWGEKSIDELHRVLTQMHSIDVRYMDKDLQSAYSEIDAYSKRKFPDKLGQLLNGSSKTMGKNDLWIAATAKVLDAELITADSDFDHLHNVFITVHNFKPLKRL